MIFGSFSVSQFTSGSKSSQPESPITGPFNSLSIVNLIILPECAQRVSIVASKCQFSNRPSTKGAAIASSAQAAQDGRLAARKTRCDVWSEVKGYAQVTLPVESLAKKNNLASNSLSI
jgi:hypothetical protein